MRILWLKTELLHPVDKGGKIRTYHMLKELKRDHYITYIALDDGTADADSRLKAKEYCNELISIPHISHEKYSANFYFELALNVLSPLPYFMTKYHSARMKEQISIQLSAGNYDVLVCDFLMPSINVPKRTPCATVLFQHNVEAMIWKRHYQVASDPLKKMYLYGQWLKTRNYEKTRCRLFDEVVAVSVEDANTMKRDYGLGHVSDVPTGVDTQFFRPSTSETERHNLVFTGSMDWLPNSDAINYFAEAILPKIRERIPDVSLTVVGRNPTQSLRDLSKREPSVQLTGRVEDVRPYIAKAEAYIVPLRVGGGTRLKIFEAMAMERPLISTTIGAEGLPLENGDHILLADTPEAFAAAVVRVLKDRVFADSLAKRGAKKVRECFGWDKAAKRFGEICEHGVRTHNLQSGAKT